MATFRFSKARCQLTCPNLSSLISQTSLGEAVNDSDLQSAIFNAVVLGPGVVFGIAGNNGIDISSKDIYPCRLDAVVCVGGADFDTNNIYNYGDGVDICADQVAHPDV